MSTVDIEDYECPECGEEGFENKESATYPDPSERCPSCGKIKCKEHGYYYGFEYFGKKVKFAHPNVLRNKKIRSSKSSKHINKSEYK